MAGRGDIKIQDIQPDLYSDWPVVPFDKSLGEIGSYVKIKSSEYNNDGLYPVIDQGEKYISGYVNDSNLLYKGDLPIIIFGDHTRNIKYVDSDFAVGADGTKILHPIKQFYCKFYYHYLKALTIPNLGYSRHYSILRQINVPLPPLAEQKRIADKLDVLFGQLNIVQKAIERIPELIKNFRQQILSSAVTGKLTEEWRKNQQLPQWSVKYLSNVAIPKSGFPFKASDFVEQGLQVIRMGNLYNNRLSLERNPVFVPKDYNEDIIKKSIINKGDILLTLTGTKYKRDYGYAIKVDSDEILLLNQRILALTPLINADYLLLALRSEGFRNQFFSFETGGVNQGNVGIKNVMTIQINIPPAEEQTEIVEITNSIFKKLETIEQQYNALKSKIEKLPQALLNKAFSGELVEHLPSDGDAETLLKEIEQLKRTISKK